MSANLFCDMAADNIDNISQSQPDFGRVLFDSSDSSEDEDLSEDFGIESHDDASPHPDQGGSEAVNISDNTGTSGFPNMRQSSRLPPRGLPRFGVNEGASTSHSPVRPSVNLSSFRPARGTKRHADTDERHEHRDHRHDPRRDQQEDPRHDRQDPPRDQREDPRHNSQDELHDPRLASPERKKRFRLQRMLRNSVLNDSRENLISERRKLERDNQDFRDENQRLKAELRSSRRELLDAKHEIEVERDVTEACKERIKRQAALITMKGKIIDQKTQEVAKLRFDVEQMERAASAPSNASPDPDGEFFKDVMANLKDGIESQLACSICTEVFLNPTTTCCGHSFCYDCLEEWEGQNSTCPVCRTHLACKHKSTVLESYIEKFVSQFFTESAKAARTALAEDRKKKKEERRTRRTLLTFSMVTLDRDEPISFFRRRTGPVPDEVLLAGRRQRQIRADHVALGYRFESDTEPDDPVDLPPPPPPTPPTRPRAVHSPTPGTSSDSSANLGPFVRMSRRSSDFWTSATPPPISQIFSPNRFDSEPNDSSSPSSPSYRFDDNSDNEEEDRFAIELSGDDEIENVAPSHSSSLNDVDSVSSISQNSSFSHSSEGAEFSASGFSPSDSNDEV